ncbi:MAG: DUF1592 domain-containing protein [Planctomycetota bacterium]
MSTHRSQTVRLPTPSSLTVSLWCAGLIMCSILIRPGSAEEPESDASVTQWKGSGLPLLTTYCIDCHNEDLQEGGLDLSPFETMSDVSMAEVNRVLEMVRFGAMPPSDADLPETDERKQLVAALEATLYSTACDLGPKSDGITIRRLNRSEYNRTVRDLFGVDLRPADRFPSDEVGGGFDNNANMLTTSPILVEKYMDAAERVAAAAILDPAELPRLSLDVAPDQLPVDGDYVVGRFNGRFVKQEALVWIDFETPYEGDYRIDVRGGVVSRSQKPMRVAVYDETQTLRGIQPLKYYGGGGGSQSFRIRIKLSKGKHRLAFVPIANDDETDFEVDTSKTTRLDELQEEKMAAILQQLGEPIEPARRISHEEYPFMFRSLRVSGPERFPDEVFPPQQFQLIRSIAPERGEVYRDVEYHASKNLRPFMRLAFRGDVTDEEVRPYAQLAEQMTREGKSFHRAMQVAISALLVSPRFLYRIETPPADAEPNDDGDFPLTQSQLASRLSYLVWSSTPDEALLRNAEQRKLDDKRLRSEVARMIHDERAEALASDFAAQWLGLRNLDDHEADQETFPGFSGELREAMADETEALFLHLLRENRPVRELLTADYSFLNARLAEHYGITARPAGLERVSLRETPRRGILSHASILTLTSTPTRTSPVLRGKWILENILGTKPPDPPPGVPELEETKTADLDATLRQQLELHREVATCASCHRVMDQLGFGLDDFDAVGRYRTTDGKVAIDASGALPDGRSFDGAAELASILAESEVEALARTLTRRLLAYAIGREVRPGDRCTIDDILERTRDEDYPMADILTEVVLSRPFRFESHRQPTANSPAEDTPAKP